MGVDIRAISKELAPLTSKWDKTPEEYDLVRANAEKIDNELQVFMKAEVESYEDGDWYFGLRLYNLSTYCDSGWNDLIDPVTSEIILNSMLLNPPTWADEEQKKWDEPHYLNAVAMMKFVVKEELYLYLC